MRCITSGRTVSGWGRCRSAIVEITGLTWGQVNLSERVVTVGRAKTSSGTGRQIPMNRELFEVFTTHAAWFTNRFGAAEAEHHLFPFGKPMPSDPTRPITDISSAWDSLRDWAGVKCRLHDMRHTVATKMAEAGTPESTMLSLLGHMSSAMLERYSHIRMTAKRTAVETLSLKPAPKAETLAAAASIDPNPNGVPTKAPTDWESKLIQ
jgi:integrase